MKRGKIVSILNVILATLGFLICVIAVIWAYDFSIQLLETAIDISEGDLDYKVYGNITDIKSISGGGLMGGTKCVVDINNNSEVLVGDVCDMLIKGQTLYKADTLAGSLWNVSKK